MTRCEGTSAKQALANQFVQAPQVTKLFHTYQLSEGIVAIGHDRAYEHVHVRNCINSMKKAKTYMPVQLKSLREEHSNEVCLISLIHSD